MALAQAMWPRSQLDYHPAAIRPGSSLAAIGRQDREACLTGPEELKHFGVEVDHLQNGKRLFIQVDRIEALGDTLDVMVTVEAVLVEDLAVANQLIEGRVCRSKVALGHGAGDGVNDLQAGFRQSKLSNRGFLRFLPDAAGFMGHKHPANRRLDCRNHSSERQDKTAIVWQRWWRRKTA